MACERPLELRSLYYIDTDRTKILFGLHKLLFTVMLRHEASAAYETDASWLSMKAGSKKIARQSRTNFNWNRGFAFQKNQFLNQLALNYWSGRWATNSLVGGSPTKLCNPLRCATFPKSIIIEFLKLIVLKIYPWLVVHQPQLCNALPCATAPKSISIEFLNPIVLKILFDSESAAKAKKIAREQD